jgi:acyl dehydratase
MHCAVPPVEYLPAAHRLPVPEPDPATHAEPAAAVQSLHVDAPAAANLPAGQIAADGADDVDPAGHA